MARMRVATGEFNIVVEGPEAAPPVLLSNSLGTDLHMWDDQAEALKTRFRVIRYDSRGHGQSVADEGPYSIEQLGQDAIAILDALDIPRAHFVGLSKGGMVGMWLLVNARERIGRAVLANTSAQLGNPDLWNTRIRTARAEGMAALTAATMDRWFTRDFQEASPQAVERIARMFRSTPAQGYAACCAAIRDMDQREAIRSIANPVLVIVGKHDPATTPTMGGLIADHIKGARLTALEAAHLSNIEAANAFNRAILSFLSAPGAGQAVAQAAPEPPAKAPAKTRAKQKKPPAKAASGKAASGKAETVKAAIKTTASKKSATKKAATKKAAKKKAASRKSAAARAASTGKAAKKTALKKAAAKKRVIKKTAAKSARKAAKKKTAKKGGRR